MSDPYRGFVELPLAVLDALRECSQAVLEQAVERAQLRARPLLRTTFLDQLEALVAGVLGERGFTRLSATREELTAQTRFAARHRCGAWAVAVVDDEVTQILWPRERATADRVDRVIDGLHCYCVEHRPMLQALHAWAEQENPLLRAIREVKP